MDPIYPINTRLMIQLERRSALELTPTDRTELIDQMNAVLSDLEVLRTCPGTNTQPEAENCPLRADEVLSSTDRTILLANAPETDGEYFLVPRTVE